MEGLHQSGELYGLRELCLEMQKKRFRNAGRETSGAYSPWGNGSIRLRGGEEEVKILSA